MCKISRIIYTCEHYLDVVHSHCGKAIKNRKVSSRGELIPQIRATLSTSSKNYGSACCQNAYIAFKYTEECAPCQLIREEAVLDAQGVPQDDEVRTQVANQWPKMNWAAPGGTVVERTPKTGERRRTSLLSNEVFREDVKDSPYLQSAADGFVPDGECGATGDDSWSEVIECKNSNAASELTAPVQSCNTGASAEEDDDAYDLDSDSEFIEVDIDADTDTLSALFASMSISLPTLGDFEIEADHDTVMEYIFGGSTQLASSHAADMFELSALFDFDTATFDEKQNDDEDSGFEEDDKAFVEMLDDAAKINEEMEEAKWLLELQDFQQEGVATA